MSAILGRRVETEELLTRLRRYGLIRHAKSRGGKQASLMRCRWNLPNYRRWEKLGFDGLGLGL